MLFSAICSRKIAAGQSSSPCMPIATAVIWRLRLHLGLGTISSISWL